jgi:hypothetical protein
MIFKKSAIYKGIKYIRVEGEDYFSSPIPHTRCEIYDCEYEYKKEGKCIWCNKVMKKTGANKFNITFGYVPIN